MSEIVSALYQADVLPARKRNEVRRPYRIDVPVEFARASRKDLVPAVEIVNLNSRGVELPVLTLHGLRRAAVAALRRQPPADRQAGTMRTDRGGRNGGHDMEGLRRLARRSRRPEQFESRARRPAGTEPWTRYH